MTSKKKSLAYGLEPLLYHQEVYAFVMQCFPDEHFVVQYQSTDLRSDVHISGYKFSEGFTNLCIRNSWPIPAIKECMTFSIVQETNPEARNTYDTNFWVTIHTFQPCKAAADGQIQSLMERMIEFMQMLEEASPGEYRLKLDRDIPSTWDENLIDGVNMRALFTLAHGQTRLNTLGIQDHLFDSKYLDFNNAYLQSNFLFPSRTAKVQTFQAYRGKLDVPNNIPKTGQVFQGIYKRIRFWNDELNKDSNTAVDTVEIDLYCKIIDAHVADVEKFFPSNKIHMLKIQRQRAPEPDDDEKAASIPKTPKTPAQRLSKPYYISAFPTAAEERETIRKEVKSRRKQPTL